MCNLYEYELQEWEIAHLIEHYRLLGTNWTEAMKVYPNRPGAVVVGRAGERVVVDMLWGLTPWGKGTWLTNFRNPHLKTWKPLIDKKAQRCVVPATRFAEPDRNISKPVQWRWFARPNRKPFLFAGVWTKWSGDRGTKKVPNVGEHLLYSFMTTDPNAIVEPIHDEAMPVILTTPAEVEQWLRGTAAEALALQKPAANDVIELVSEEKEAAQRRGSLLMLRYGR